MNNSRFLLHQALRRGLPVLAAVFALAWAGHAAYQHHQFEKAQAMSEEWFEPEKPQPRCVGRLQFEVPKGAVQHGSLYEYRGAETQLEEKQGVNQEDFEKHVAAFEATLRETKHEKDPSLLRSVHVVPGVGKVFVHWKDDYSTVLMDITGLAWKKGVQYRFNTRSDLDKIQLAKDEALQLLQTFLPKAEYEVPTEPGFCFDTAFVPDTLKGERVERSEISFDVSPWPDVNFNIDTAIQRVKEKDSLLDRARTMKTLPNFGVVRSDERTVNGMRGQEVVTLIEEEDRTFYLFRWELEGQLDRNDPPSIVVELWAGQNGKPGEISKVQALALWEYLMAHLRLRSTAPAKTSQVALPKTPLGELAATGRECPQTGWWQCADAGEVQGGRRQYFRAGERMPHAVLLGEPSVWQKLKGERPSYQTATVWQLVDYESGPGPMAEPGKAIGKTAAEESNTGSDGLPPNA